jgi:hypothetical protein
MSMMKKQQVEDIIKSKIIKMLMLNIQLNDILNQKYIFGIIKTLNLEIGGFQKIYGISLFYFFFVVVDFFQDNILYGISINGDKNFFAIRYNFQY